MIILYAIYCNSYNSYYNTRFSIITKSRPREYSDESLPSFGIELVARLVQSKA